MGSLVLNSDALNCQTCGACCACFRVDFHPAELAGGDFAWAEGVPPEITVRLNDQLVRMQGTDSGFDSPPRCVALSGRLGVVVNCTIYASRPGPCRDFEAGSDACLRARRRLFP